MLFQQLSRLNASTFSVSPTSTLKDLVQVIDRCEAKIALVVDHTGRLLGTVTDGDVRRSLINGGGVATKSGDVMRVDFRAIPSDATETDITLLMKKCGLHQLPTLDTSGRPVDIYFFPDQVVPKTMPNPILIMAGGEGRRLRPFTDSCPKPMLKVAGKPILEIILEQCIDAGFSNYYFSVNYLKEDIKKYFDDGDRWGISISYLEEHRPLGTAGALSLFPRDLGSPIVMMNGDVLNKVDFRHLVKFHNASDADLTVCVRESATQIPFGIVNTEDSKVLSIVEKPTIINTVNAGIYVINQNYTKLVPEDSFYDMPEFVNDVIGNGGKVAAFPIHEYWLDVGEPNSYKKAREEWR